ncbi:MAG: 2-oxoglutarate and iron-dependent oxygenase domain-containing protein [bacterium]
MQSITAVNQDFRQYDQVNKDRTYHLSEGGGEEQFDTETEIKTCDLSQFFHGGDAGKTKFAQELGEAMEGIGFVILVGHGIDTALYSQAEKRIRELFLPSRL